MISKVFFKSASNIILQQCANVCSCMSFLATIYILIIMDGEWLLGDRVVDTSPQTADWWDYTPESYSGHHVEL